MNEFRIRVTGAVVTEPEFRAMHAQVFPQVLDVATLAAYGADPVLQAPAPVITTTQTVSRNGAMLDGLGNWVHAWTVANLPVEAIAANLADAKASKWEAIKAERDRRESAGVLVGVKWFHSDADSRIKQLGLVMAGASIPVGLQWKTLDGSFVTMTQTLAGQIFNASLAASSAIFIKAEQHKAAMEVSADPANYDHLAGWPAVPAPAP